MKYILIINAGSSSLKVKIFESRSLIEKASCLAERVGLTRSFLVYQEGKKLLKINFSTGLKDHHRALKEFIKILPSSIYKQIMAVGHRIVHGGEQFVLPTTLNQKVIKQISRYNDFAPLHNPANLKTALSAITELPRAKHFGVFDTEFFKDLPKVAYLYPLPLKYYQNYRLRKYGFHGLSHENMLAVSTAKLGKKELNLITCHLGNGVSVSAIKNGRVIETSMGLTPLSGAMMATRSGDLDPFIPLFMIKNLKLSADEVYQELNYHSGLKGVCGAEDLRDVCFLAGEKVPGYNSPFKRSKAKKELARLAINMYVYRLQNILRSYAGLLPRVDAVVFSGGVGENRLSIRQAITSGIHFANRPRILIVKANEELVIAKKIFNL